MADRPNRTLNDMDNSIDSSTLDVENCLDFLLPGHNSDAGILNSAMRCALLGKAKRSRALYVIFRTLQYGGKRSQAMRSACAIEMIHAASLIFDDLPSMDNSEFRRGQAATHIAFSEPTAILTGIGLMNLAFGVVSEDKTLPDTKRTRIISVLSQSIGADGLIAGQQDDLDSVNQDLTSDQILKIYERKTSALFMAAFEIGGIIVGRDENDLQVLRKFGSRLGIVFQILDDLSDAYATQDKTLKSVRLDNNKPNMISGLGEQDAFSKSNQILAETKSEAARLFGDNSILSSYTNHLLQILHQRLAA